MTRDLQKPHVTAGGLVTVAFLKARLDEGDDHLGIFMPLLLDVMAGLGTRYFLAADVQEAMEQAHGVAMPQEAIKTLLKRAAKKKIVIRESGRYKVNADHELERANVSGQKAQIAAAQLRLGDSLKAHAIKRGLGLETSCDALELLMRFVDGQQVAILLGLPPDGRSGAGLTPVESQVVAEFIHDIAAEDQALSSVFQGVLEGLVLYHAAFLPDLAGVDRRFRDLNVVFDSVLVRHALGYEGTGVAIPMRETIDLLRASGADCIVFDKTVEEIQRILAMYRDRLGTDKGRRGLHQVPMARHFLTQCYSPSDVHEMSVRLEAEIAAVGLTIRTAPMRAAKFTADEASLARRLEDPQKHDHLEPRVLHDVDCVAGVLTLRRGVRAHRLEEAKAVFATSSPLVIRNTRLWWEEDELEAGVSPIVHIRALANLAWLKKPRTTEDLQMSELVALCAACMRPAQRTWQRFLKHLDQLQAAQRLSQDEATAIIVSAVSDRLLREAELDEDDPEDIDASTLDEVVERVKADYAAEAEKRVESLATSYDQQLKDVSSASDLEVAAAKQEARSASERLRRRDLAIEGRARRWSTRIVAALFWVVALLLTAGELAFLLTFSFGGGAVGVLVGMAVVVATGFAIWGAMRHILELRSGLQLRLEMRMRGWLSQEAIAAENDNGCV